MLELRMLFLDEKNSRLEFERNLNLKISNLKFEHQFSQNKLETTIQEQKAEIQRLKTKESENEAKMKKMENEMKKNSQKVANQFFNENYSRLAFEKKLDSKLEKIENEQLSSARILDETISEMKKQNENLEIKNRKNEEKIFKLEKNLKNFQEKFAEINAAEENSRLNLKLKELEAEQKSFGKIIDELKKVNFLNRNLIKI